MLTSIEYCRIDGSTPHEERIVAIVVLTTSYNLFYIIDVSSSRRSEQEGAAGNDHSWGGENYQLK